MDKVLLVSTLFVEALMILIALHTAFNKKFCVNLYSVGIVIGNCLLFLLINLDLMHQLFSMFIYILLWLYCYYRFRLTVKKTIITYVIGLVLACLIEIVSSYMLIPFQRRFELNEVAFGSGVLALGIMIALYRIRMMSSTPDNGKYSKTKVVISCMYGIVLASLIVNYYHHMKNISVYALIILTFMFLAYIYLHQFERAKIQAEKKQLELDMQNLYGKAYDELLQSVRIRQHDFKNQLGALYSMHVVAGSLDELICMQKEYGANLAQNSKFDSILTCCENSILAGYLYSRCIECEESGLDVIYDVHVRECECNFAMYEIIELLGILIDNACESTLKQETGNKCIKFTCNEDNTQIVLVVSNPSRYMSGIEIEKMFSHGYSTRGKNRGIGLARALELVKQKDAEIKVTNSIYEKCNWIDFSVVLQK